MLKLAGTEWAAHAQKHAAAGPDYSWGGPMAFWKRISILQSTNDDRVGSEKDNVPTFVVVSRRQPDSAMDSIIALRP